MVLDTIEIQDVRVLSETVFANMQARFRQEQERVAREAELAKERFIRREEAEAERQIALTRLATAVDGANPFGYIAAAVEGVMGLARSAGLHVPTAPKKDPPI